MPVRVPVIVTAVLIACIQNRKNNDRGGTVNSNDVSTCQVMHVIGRPALGSMGFPHMQIHEYTEEANSSCHQYEHDTRSQR